jgi:hypothetical protein
MRLRRPYCGVVHISAGNGACLGFEACFEAFPDELPDGFGARWEAIGPSVLIDLLEEPGRDRDDDARIWLLGFAGHGRSVPWGQRAVNMRRMRAA